MILLYHNVYQATRVVGGGGWVGKGEGKDVESKIIVSSLGLQ